MFLQELGNVVFDVLDVLVLNFLEVVSHPLGVALIGLGIQRNGDRAILEGLENVTQDLTMHWHARHVG